MDWIHNVDNVVVYIGGVGMNSNIIFYTALSCPVLTNEAGCFCFAGYDRRLENVGALISTDLLLTLDDEVM